MNTLTDKLAAALLAMEQHAASVCDGYPPDTVSNAWEPHRKAAREALAEYDAQRESEKRTFTVFCREASGDGTIFISSAEGICAEEAARKVLDECAEAWGMNSSAIDVIGIAAGDVQIIDWQDEPHSGGIVLDRRQIRRRAARR